MKEEAYSNGSAVDGGRYNILNIKGSTIKVIHRLIDVGLIGFKKGHPAQDGYERGHVSRIWSSPKLIKMFETVQNTKVAIKLNANSQLALENMLINFCEAA
jgi:hypothetical protein